MLHAGERRQLMVKNTPFITTKLSDGRRDLLPVRKWVIKTGLMMSATRGGGERVYDYEKRVYAYDLLDSLNGGIIAQ